MKKPYLPVLIVFWLIAGAFASVWVACSQMRKLSIPIPVSAQNKPVLFYVIGFDHSGKPMALLLEDTTVVETNRRYCESRDKFMQKADFMQRMERNRGPILWRKNYQPGKRYTFYIPRNKIDYTNEAANKAIMGPQINITVRLISDNPEQKKQTVQVDYFEGDFGCHSVYSVDSRGVKPLKYGDLRERDWEDAFCTGVGFYIILIVTGAALLFIPRIVRKARSTREGT